VFVYYQDFFPQIDLDMYGNDNDVTLVGKTILPNPPVQSVIHGLGRHCKSITNCITDQNDTSSSDSEDECNYTNYTK